MNPQLQDKLAYAANLCAGLNRLTDEQLCRLFEHTHAKTPILHGQEADWWTDGQGGG